MLANFCTAITSEEPGKNNNRTLKNVQSCNEIQAPIFFILLRAPRMSSHCKNLQAPKRVFHFLCVKISVFINPLVILFEFTIHQWSI